MDNFEAYFSTVLEVATRALFCRIIDSGTEAALAMKVIAFWMWLESQGFSDIIKVISSVDDHEFLAQVTEEAESVVFSLQGHSAPSLRATQNLAPDFDSLNALISEKDKVSMGISNFYKRVCYVMFKDILEERNIKLEDQQGEGIVQASCSKVGGTETVESSGPSVPFKLNPFAPEWNPLKDRANESDRCLFLTFSNGYPLNESQIVNFFTQKFGACIERVYVHWENRTDEKMPPLFGKVVFDASYVPASILKGEKEAKFMVEGKPLWCKEFVQKKQKRERN